MDVKQLVKLYEKQLKIEETITKELQKFKKNNTDRKYKVADEIYLKVRGLKLKFDRNHEVLSQHKLEVVKNNKIYFAINVHGRCEKVVKEFLELLRQFISSSIVANKKPEECLDTSCETEDSDEEDDIMSGDEDAYLKLRDDQANLLQELQYLATVFDKLEEDKKVEEKADFLKKLEKLENIFSENNLKLEKLKKGRETRSYFANNTAGIFTEQCKHLDNVIGQFNPVTQKADEPKVREMSSDENKMTTMEKLLQQLAEAQVSKTKNSVQLLCSKFIVSFDSKNVRSFLNSVKDCLDEFRDEDDIKKVLRFAKNRVTGNAIISASEFNSFEEFEQLMNQQFKPVKDHLQVNHEISFLMQKGNESVTQFGARAVLLKVEYVEALFSAYKANGEKLPISRMQEAESLVTKHFVLGLKRDIKINIRSEPKTLTEAIGFAEAAATAASLAEVSRNATENRNSGAKNFNFRGGFRGAPRGGRGGANGRQGNGGPGFSGHNSSSGVNAQAQSVTNESKGCWICGDENHRKFECPNKASVSKAGRGGFGYKPKNQQSASSAQVSALAMQGQSQRDCE